jgi:DNA polymerase I-like protein with 3'-5' exonuclease and polymerase domains
MGISAASLFGILELSVMFLITVSKEIKEKLFGKLELPKRKKTKKKRTSEKSRRVVNNYRKCCQIISIKIYEHRKKLCEQYKLREYDAIRLRDGQRLRVHFEIEQVN